jgi:hypothetical protein
VVSLALRVCGKTSEQSQFSLLNADRAPFELVFSVSAAQSTDFRPFALLGLPDSGLMGTPLGNHLFMVTQPPSPA